MPKIELTEVILREIEEQVTKNVLARLAQTRISGDQVNGGLIQNFGSTGIQDSASSCQVTIMDQATVIENNLIVPSIEVKGDLTVDGDLKLLGEIPTDSPFYRDMVEHAAGILKLAMDGQFFLQYVDKIFEKIKEEGIDLNKIKLDGNDIVVGNKLGYFVTDTNIRRLGELLSLVVKGEVDLSNTMHVRNKRVGINTDEPGGALAVWDEECELVARKLRKDVSSFGSMRNQRVVLSSNNKNNIVLETDGTVSIEKLNIGAIQLFSVAECPTFDADRGSIAFNENVSHGKPCFWSSLGGAKWIAGPTAK